MNAQTAERRHSNDTNIFFIRNISVCLLGKVECVCDEFKLRTLCVSVYEYICRENGKNIEIQQLLVVLQLDFFLQKGGEGFAEEFAILAKIMFKSSIKQQTFGKAVC